MGEDIYRRLAEHLDRLPDGFPPSDTGADLRLLQRLFAPQEAELATHLTLSAEGAGAIAARAGLAQAEAEERLNEMSRKGLIFAIAQGDGPTLYHAAPWVVGILEMQVNRLDAEMLRDLDEYGRTRKPRPPLQNTPQVRTIPVGESIGAHLEALPYEQVAALVQAHDRFAVAPCICRRLAHMRGAGCEAPAETCLFFGDWADQYVRSGQGRRIDRAEVQAILARADDANLVLQPSNSADIALICCCCGCCCAVLRGLKSNAKPAEVVASAFVARLDAELCQGCWTCLERCQMAALRAEGDTVVLDVDRCIGCGLCVSRCPSGALTLARKPRSARTEVPETMDATWRRIVEAQDAAR